ncbi:hypothetical protein J8J14_00040 [Roseomonas sp. SSH11]|uniref:Uncharacterized protein n=1 Tax=Pararoseomonas baculiformis TaxID=2820812 RepID=A0ABS4A9E7_9PROT|nr:hypothetical protein [Pararoseomonas baculiformis]
MKRSGITLDFEVTHRVVGEYHVFFVPKEVPEARGAGLIVSDKDQIRAMGLFEVAMATARRHGKVPQSARWHLHAD